MGHERVELYLTYSHHPYAYAYANRVLAGAFELNMLRDKCYTDSGHRSKATTDNLFIRIDSLWHPLSALFTRRSWYRFGNWNWLDGRTLHIWKLDEMAGYIGGQMRRNLHLNRFVTVKGARYGHQWSDGCSGISTNSLRKHIWQGMPIAQTHVPLTHQDKWHFILNM